MQGSKQIERAVRTRTKNPERVAKALERKRAERAICGMRKSCRDYGTAEPTRDIGVP